MTSINILSTLIIFNLNKHAKIKKIKNSRRVLMKIIIQSRKSEDGRQKSKKGDNLKVPLLGGVRGGFFVFNEQPEKLATSIFTDY